jgi:DNA-binding MarR family transcriptional regulator
MPNPLQFDFATPEDSPGFLLWRVTNAWQRATRAALEPYGLTHAQFVILAVLGWMNRTPDPVTQSQLASRAGTDVMMTSQIVRALEERGLIERRVNPSDTRARWLRATDTGLELVARAVKVVEANDAAFFAVLETVQGTRLETAQGTRLETVQGTRLEPATAAKPQNLRSTKLQNAQGAKKTRQARVSSATAEFARTLRRLLEKEST